MIRVVLSAVLLVSVGFLSGCSGEKKAGEGVGQFGMMDESTAEYSAIQFLDNLYNTNDVNEVLKYASPKMSRLIRSYRTPSNIQRHVINLRIDEATFEVDSGRNVGLSQYADEANLSVYFIGKLHGEKVEDLRTIYLTKHNGRWKVDEVKDNRYLNQY